MDIFLNDKSLQAIFDSAGLKVGGITELSLRGKNQINADYATKTASKYSNLLAKKTYGAKQFSYQISAVSTVGNIYNAITELEASLAFNGLVKLSTTLRPDEYWLVFASAGLDYSVDINEALPKATFTLSFEAPDSRSYSTVDRLVELGTTSEYGELKKVKNGEYEFSTSNKYAETEPKIEIQTADENNYLAVAGSDGSAVEMGNLNTGDERAIIVYDARDNASIADFYSKASKGTGLAVEQREKPNGDGIRMFDGSLLKLRGINKNTFRNEKKGFSSLSWEIPGNKQMIDNFWWRWNVWAGRTNQTGTMQLVVSDANNRMIYGAEIIKRRSWDSCRYNIFTGDPNNGTYALRFARQFFVNNEANQNPFRPAAGYSHILRTDRYLDCYWFGSFYRVPSEDLKGRIAKKISLNMLVSDDPITHMYFSEINFRQADAKSWSDVGNYFEKNSKVVIDSAKRTVDHNGIQRISDVVKSPRFPQLKHGDNKLSILTSSWIKQDPKIKITWKERKN